MLRPDETAITAWDRSEDLTAVDAPPRNGRHAAAAGIAAAARDGGRAPRHQAAPLAARGSSWPAATFAALVVVGLLLGLVFDGPGGSAASTGPLSEDEVRDVAESFADAYAAEDPAALRATLARSVVRTAPGGTTNGRDAVVDQYARQFDGKVGGYDLSDLEVEGGRAGRAEGSYHVDRDERRPVRRPHRLRSGPRARRAADRTAGVHSSVVVLRTAAFAAQQLLPTSTCTLVPRRTSVPGSGSWPHTDGVPGSRSSSRPPRSSTSASSPSGSSCC